ncbi:DUF928 domain-containing protein [Geminocystis sp. NIES-3709]|uniref:DUF928 domain-containing protein n=1 Tax=Geminocystis sp. NIES-3709 TaxID=1617448 RepID=UPI0005FC5901|nr:DUF928 domain-containing protein [Geminocystis sp. NIES-3709]BAQ64950.1 membrane proteins related to metalloendopeptidases [Geminocystis sp. NIES-3709]
MLKIQSKSVIFVSLFMAIVPFVDIFSSVKAIEFPNAPKREAPQSTAAGGRRGGCVSGNIPIMPLTPSKDNSVKTVSPQPEFFVYIPPTKAKFVQFVLKDETGNTLDSQEMGITEGDQVVTINVGEKVNLETDKKYTWEISLICNPMIINTSNYTKGIIERVSLEDNVKKELLANKDIVKQAEIYANNNIWQDTISLVASVKESQPQQWEELLTSVGLENLADKKLINQ